ncbi:ergothioneine biosynthesis protein EgtC [Streptomyces zingiberis]|uniref:Gamma-glutamyl-hercynylcysteine sulfoxide hydrolase n=1 Tax=Streptomyces zingiberis TaxID=2053010 RepID=A0ABX1C3W7_9ACTN|nr:ergothioneine biosynthesis protein EgtC [Streptomyces zingiberis]NJQ02622.1 ergothioneine biosynthesis protein EgtC [Streptomyces zingiberis]
MCRHLAYLGPAVPWRDVLVTPEHALYRQSWAPRRQRYGTVNADGFGVGWYAPGDPVPARYRRAGPVWADPSFTDLARVVRTHALLAAVRDATEPGADGEAATAPFASGPWLFSHNGALTGWPASAAPLTAALPPEDLLTLEARCDSAFVWALVRHALRRPQGKRQAQGHGHGDALAPTPGDALGSAVARLSAAAPGSRLNLLLTDGATIAATAWGDTLWYLAGPAAGRTVVASEPYDGDPRWTEVPDRTLLTATRTDVLLTPLKEPS